MVKSDKMNKDMQDDQIVTIQKKNVWALFKWCVGVLVKCLRVKVLSDVINNLGILSAINY